MKVKDLLEEFKSLWCDKIFKTPAFIRNISYGVENLIKWFPIIWQDRDWDHWFLYNIIHFKLKEMENLYRKYGWNVHAEKTAGKIKLCKCLLNRLIKDEYLENALKPCEKKWGERHINWNKKRDDLMNFIYDKAKTEKEIKQAEKDFRYADNHSDMMKEQDLDLLFKKMRKHIEGWWD